MRDLLRSFGLPLTALFAALVVAWGLVLIILPQLTMAERALTPPTRALDSSIAATLRFDASTCRSVLEIHRAAEEVPAQSGGLAIPSPSGGALAIPSMNSGGAASAHRPYVLQCDRATTHTRLVRSDGEVAWLDETYDLPLMGIDDSAPLETQIEQAGALHDLALDLQARLQALEANAPAYTLDNFRALTAARAIPMSDEMRAEDDASLVSQLQTAMGLRYVQDDTVHVRLGLANLARTLVFAVMVTMLALAICYPVAYKVALAAPPAQVMWLLLGLVIPYAIVELMRIYAWTTILDNRGLINSALMATGLIDEPVRFTRMPGTVFLVIAYTYVLFMVFPMLNTMSTLDRNQLEAARDLGASPWRMHWRVVIPHAKPGIAVGCIATFMLAAGAFSVPRIISRGLQAEWFSQTIYNKFFESENSNVGAAYSFAYTLVCVLIVALFMALMRTRLKDFARAR